MSSIGEITRTGRGVPRRNVLKGIATAGALGSFPGIARADTPIPIDGCTTITRSGTYVLTRDLQSDGTCLRIRASNVIFDGQGHRIEAADPQERTGHGIDIRPRLGGQLSNVTVRDVTVRGFRNGIAVQDTRASTIHRVTATENNIGMFVNGTEMRLTSNTVSHNTDTGIAIRGSRNSVTNNTVATNSLRGIYVRDFSFGARILGNTVTEHQSEYGEAGSPGIVLRGGTGSHLVATNELGGNRVGILLLGSGRNTIRRNVAIESRFSTDVAIRLQSASHDNLVAFNSFERGIQVTGSDGNTLRGNTVSTIDILGGEGNTASDNDVRGVSVRRSSDTMIVGNTIASGAFRTAASVENSPDTVIRGNVISDGTLGIGLRDSVRARVEFNGVVNNANGVRLTGAGAATVTIRANNFLENARYGVENEIPEVVDARFNYWGASSGPSSPEDPNAPFADPVTGELADGSGDAVSESPADDGVSNVRFHPWSRVENPVITLPPIDPGPPIDPPREPPRGPGPVPSPD